MPCTAATSVHHEGIIGVTNVAHTNTCRLGWLAGSALDDMPSQELLGGAQDYQQGDDSDCEEFDRARCDRLVASLSLPAPNTSGSGSRAPVSASQAHYEEGRADPHGQEGGGGSDAGHQDDQSNLGDHTSPHPGNNSNQDGSAAW